MKVSRAVLLIVQLCSIIAKADVICNRQLPPSFLPSLGSCQYAIKRLEAINAQCGASPVIWTAQPGGFGAFRLPLMFVGQGPDYTPPSRIWCSVLVLWQPRTGAPMPPPTLTDVFPFSSVLYAARRIVNICLVDRPRSPPGLGREWIMPNEWVDVQTGIILNTAHLQEYHHLPSPEDRSTSVLLADGSRVNATVIHTSELRCGSITTLGERLQQES